MVLIENLFLEKKIKNVKHKFMTWSASSRLEWLMLFTAVLPFLLISFFNHPTDDDFKATVLASHQGFWASIASLYQNWTGRYTSSLLYSLVYSSSTLNYWLVALRIAPVILLLSLLGAGYFAVSGFNRSLSLFNKLRLSLYGLLLYLYGIPLVVSALYWYSGAAVYTSGLILALMMAGMIGRCANASNKTSRTAWGMFAAINGALLVGTNELMIVITLVIVIGWLLLTDQREIRWPIIVLIFSIIGTIITIVAPGNMARANTVAQTTSLLHRLGTVGAKSVYLTLSHVVSWISDGILLSATVLFVLGLHPRRQNPSIHKWLCCIIGCIVMVILTVPTLWLSNDVPARIWNVVYAIFLLSWFWCIYLAANKWSILSEWRVTKVGVRRMRIIWLAIILFGYNSAVHHAYVDLFFKAPQYNIAQQHRYKLLQQSYCKGQRDIELPALLPNEYQYPGTIFLHELELSPHNIANQGMALYFRLDSVRIKSLPNRNNRHYQN